MARRKRRVPKVVAFLSAPIGDGGTLGDLLPDEGPRGADPAERGSARVDRQDKRKAGKRARRARIRRARKRR